jgi:hypothetical protein
MLLRMSDWEAIRGEFTAAEKRVLNEAITGEVICPRGCTLDLEKAGAVGQKVVELLKVKLK